MTFGQKSVLLVIGIVTIALATATLHLPGWVSVVTSFFMSLGVMIEPKKP